MAIGNIHKIWNRDRSPVAESSIFIGMQVDGRSPAGGALPYKCESVNDEAAVFVSTKKDWPVKIVVTFNEEDFCLDDFSLLSHALKNTGGLTDDQRKLIQRADVLGYASSLSYTQHYWTELGIERYTDLQRDGA